MLKKYKTLCDKLNINYKSEMFMCIGLLILSLIMMILLSILISIPAGLLILIVYVTILYFHLSKINQKYILLVNKKQKAFEIIFLTIINYIKINNSLVDALNNSLPFCNEILKEDLNELIMNINEDNSLEPFLRFADNFSDEQTKNKVIYLHSLLNITNTSECLYVLQTFCNDESHISSSYLIEHQSKRVEKLKIAPLVLSIVSVLIIFAYIFSSIGEITNG